MVSFPPVSPQDPIRPPLLTHTRHMPSPSHSSKCLISFPFVFCAMFPLETLPPGDPSGGVVYLRIVLSPEDASCLQGFLKMNVLQGGVVSTSPNPQAGGPPLVGCPRLSNRMLQERKSRQCPRHTAYRGRRHITLLILKLYPNRDVNITPRPLYPRKEPRYSLNWGLGWSQSRFGPFAEEKKKLLL